MEGLANHMIISGPHKRNILRPQNHKMIHHIACNGVFFWFVLILYLTTYPDHGQVWDIPSSLPFSLPREDVQSLEYVNLIHTKMCKYSNGVFPDAIISSLQSLQQKFGGDYHTRLLQKPMKGLHSMSGKMSSLLNM
jgi:hypothetical protein